MMQLAKKVPFDDPQVLMGVRAMYILSNVLILGLYLYTQAKINAKKGTLVSLFPHSSPPQSDRMSVGSKALHCKSFTIVWLRLTDSSFWADMTTLKYVEPAPMGTGEEAKPVTTTNMDYDKGQLRQLIRSQLMGLGMMAVMHLYMKYTNPLLIQSIIPLKGAFESNLVKIHVFGKPATGDLARPFKSAGGFMSQGQPKSDKASIESAEKNYRGGVKEE